MLVSHSPARSDRQEEVLQRKPVASGFHWRRAEYDVVRYPVSRCKPLWAANSVNGFCPSPNRRKENRYFFTPQLFFGRRRDE